MKERLMKKLMPFFVMALILCAFGMNAKAAQTEAEDQGPAEPLQFEISNFIYEIRKEVTQEDLPVGFTLGDWEYQGIAVKAGFTENSDMVCVMAQDVDTKSIYRFIYDPVHELFVPYFGTEVKNGYVYTIPVYEGAEVPYGFVEAYFVIQTVPMTTFMREDAELTQEEIAVGSLSEDNYLVFLMMNEDGKEEHYTYDLIDRTFQRSLLQKKDAEKVTELNETIDELSLEIGKLNANHAERMNKRLTLIGILIAAVVIMAGVIVNLYVKLSKIEKRKKSRRKQPKRPASEPEKAVVEKQEEPEAEDVLDLDQDE